MPTDVGNENEEGGEEGGGEEGVCQTHNNSTSTSRLARGTSRAGIHDVSECNDYEMEGSRMKV